MTNRRCFRFTRLRDDSQHLFTDTLWIYCSLGNLCGTRDPVRSSQLSKKGAGYSVPDSIKRYTAATECESKLI
jgi:hypothetical protein